MELSRREALVAGLGGLSCVALGGPLYAAMLDDMIADFTKGAAPSAGGITLTTPEIAENGNTVPVEVEAPGATAIMLLAPGNPGPAVATFNFGPAAGAQRGATRIRLTRTQDVVAYARMADGSIRRDAKTVKVTIGGCGG